MFGGFDAFQWMMYWGDRPALELTAGLILHNFFGRFPPSGSVCRSAGRCGFPTRCARWITRSLWVARPSGRRTVGSASGRRDLPAAFHCGPLPEENVERVVAEVGIEPIVFGSDFPHGRVWLFRPSMWTPS